MIESIISELKSQLGSEITSKAKVPSSQLDGIFSVIQNAAQSEIGKNLVGDGLGTVMNLFSKNQNNASANSLQQNLVNSIVSGLVEKLGLSDSVAQTISTLVVPKLIEFVTQKNSETSDDDASPITKLFGNSSSDDLLSQAGGLLGKFF